MEEDMDLFLERSRKSERKLNSDTRRLIPQRILFTEGAYSKADRIGPIIKRLTSRDLEWSGFMLCEKGDLDYIVRDVLIEEGQRIDGGNVQISGESVAKASNYLEKFNRNNGTSLYVCGWIHGHGAVYLRPSTTDEDNFKIVINSVSLNNEQRLLVPFNLIEGDVIKEVRKGIVSYFGEAIEDGG
ncbi:MAG: hypothetical protein AABY22_00910, partial [Nanoarchaeota archaeon]